jgi:iron complex transport system substrate-binding protein
MKKAIILLLFILVQNASAESKTAYYLNGTQPKSDPQRVISLAPNLTEIMFALGEGARLKGVTRYDDFPQEVVSLPKVGGFLDPSVEAILALKPDLVICVPNSGAKKRLEALARMGVAVLVIPGFELDDIFIAINILGKIFNKKNEADALIATMQKRFTRVKNWVAGKKRPKVLLVYGQRPVVAAGTGSFGNTLLALAGGQNVLGKTKIKYPTIPMEEIIRLQPEVIIDASSSGHGAEMTLEEIKTHWNRWDILPAVKSGRVHLANSALWFRPGPRIVDGLDKLVEILHPGLSHVTH